MNLIERNVIVEIKINLIKKTNQNSTLSICFFISKAGIQMD